MDRSISVLDEITNEAKRGEVLNGSYLPLLFNTYEVVDNKLLEVSKIERFYPNIFEPNLIILNRNNLNEIIYNYLEKALPFYEEEIKYKKVQNPSKFVLYNRLSNMLIKDFDDLALFFKRELEFINNEKLKDFEKGKNLGYVDALCGNLVIVISKENISSSTPYSIQISVEREINGKLYYYDFPCVKLGIYKETCFIYEVMDIEERIIKKKYADDLEYIAELESYQISIKNLLRKGIKTNEIDYNKIISLVIATNVIHIRGINDFIIPTIFLNKYNGLEISCYKSIAKNTKIYEEAVAKKESFIIDESISKIATLKKMLNEHEKLIDDENTNLVKSIKFLEELVSDYKINNYPMKKDTSLHFSITKNGGKVNNRLLSDIIDTINAFKEIEKL